MNTLKRRFAKTAARGELGSEQFTDPASSANDGTSSPVMGSFSASGNSIPSAAPAGAPSGDQSYRTPYPEGFQNLVVDSNNMSEYLKQLTAKNTKNSQVTSTSIEAELAVGEALGIYSSKLFQDGGDRMLSQALGELQQMISYVQSLRANMDAALKGKVTIPLDEFLERDVARARQKKKKFDKTLTALDNANYKILQIQKGKVNLIKLVEAEGERDAIKKAADAEAEETKKQLQELSERNKFETLEHLCEYVEEYKKFFKNGHARMISFEEKLNEYRGLVQERKDNYRSGGRKVADRVRLSPLTHEFKDINAALWEKETDKRKAMIIQLVEDERMYVKLLHSIITNYKEMMLNDEKYSPKIDREEVMTMFAGINNLQVVHEILLEDMQTALDNYPNSDIGDVFVKNARAMQQYGQYVINTSAKLDAIDRAERNSGTIKAFFKVSEEKDDANVRTLVTLPNLRAKKYERILQGLLMLTEEGDLKAHLMDGLMKLQSLLGSIEEGVEISDRLIKVLEVRNALVGYESVEPLVDKHRVYKLEGPLTVVNTSTQRKPEEHYFFLFNNLLICSKREGLLQAFGIGNTARYRFVTTIPIQSCQLKEVSDNEVMHIKNAMELTWGGGSSMILMADTPEAKQVWSTALDNVITNQPDRVFGLALEDLMTGRDAGRDIPLVLETTVNWLRAHNSKDSQGIFRLSGMMTEVQSYKAEIDRGVDNPLTNDADCNSVAGVLKLWIREMPQPIISYRLYDPFLSATRIAESAQKKKEIQNLLKELPMYNRFVLSYLMKYLHEVALLQDVNMMSPQNLSIVFGPNLMYRDGKDPFDCANFKEIYSLISYLIVEYNSVFQDIEAERDQFKLTNAVGSKPNATAAPTISQSPPASPSMPSGGLAPVGRGRGRGVMPPGGRGAPMGGLPGLPSRPGITGSAPATVPPITTNAGGALSTGTGMVSPRPRNNGESIAALQAVAQSRQAAAEQSASTSPRSLETVSPRQIPVMPKAPAPAGRGRGRNTLGDLPPTPYLPPSQPPQPAQGFIPTFPTVPSVPRGPLCAECQKPIDGQGIDVLDQKWHAECFVCAHCHKPFEGSYVPHEGKPYCTADFNDLFTRKCGGCNEPITSGFLQAIGKNWHPEHFVCNACKGSLADGFFDNGEGQPICKNCAPLFFTVP